MYLYCFSKMFVVSSLALRLIRYRTGHFFFLSTETTIRIISVVIYPDNTCNQAYWSLSLPSTQLYLLCCSPPKNVLAFLQSPGFIHSLLLLLSANSQTYSCIYKKDVPTTVSTFSVLWHFSIRFNPVVIFYKNLRTAVQFIVID